MNNRNEIKGSTPAKLVGYLICLYGLVIFGASIFVGNSFGLASLLIMAIGSLVFMVGVGLIKLNYYAWFLTIALNVILTLVNSVTLILMMINGQNENVTDITVKLFWQVIVFWLLYAARDACRPNKQLPSNIIERSKNNFSVLSALMITFATMIIIKSHSAEATGLLILGFPALIIEFGLLYLVGQKVQKKLGWETANTKKIDT